MELMQSFEQWVAGRKRVALFGASEAGRSAVEWLNVRGVEVAAFLDNDFRKHGISFCDHDVLSPTSWRTIGCPPVLISSCYARDIARQLREMGAEYRDFSFAPIAEHGLHFFDRAMLSKAEKEIEDLRGGLADEDSRQTLESLLNYRRTGDPAALKVADYPQYYHPLAAAQPGDAVVDGGAWQGDTVADFLRSVGDRGIVYAFEPDPGNFRRLVELSSSQVKPVARGLWRRTESLGMATSDSGISSRLAEDGTCSVEVVSLDDFVRSEGRDADIVKMDIEGAERAALDGAEDLLRRRAPTLQICVYHQPDDLWKLPAQIRRINSSYRFYLGHHSQNLWETVLYAVSH